MYDYLSSILYCFEADSLSIIPTPSYFETPISTLFTYSYLPRKFPSMWCMWSIWNTETYNIFYMYQQNINY